jgi:hypothetical protein
MIMRRISLFALAASAFMLVAATGALAEDVMARFEGTEQGNRGGQQVTIVVATALANGQRIKLAVPNETPRGAKAPATPAPKKEIMTAVGKLKAGDICKLDVGKEGTLGFVVTSIEPYDAKPGEDTPNGYVFSKTYDKPGKVASTLVVLTKLGVEHQFTIAMKKDEKGVMAQDPDVVAAIGKLQPGNTVWIQQQGKSVLTVIEPYVEPQNGKLGKVGETEIDGHKVPSAEVETDGGKTVTLLVPVNQVGKLFVPDRTIKAELGKVRMGSQVQFRVHEDGDKLWLREITPAPAKPAALPEKKEPPKKK